MRYPNDRTYSFFQSFQRFVTFGGERWQVVVLAFLCLFIVPVVILRTEGNILTVIEILVALSIVLLTLFRLDWGLLIFFGMVLFFDNFDPGNNPITFSLGYFWTFNAIVPNLNIGLITPMELHLAGLLFAWALFATIKKRGLKQIPVGFAAGLFFVWLFVSLLRGGHSMEELQWGLWEVRALLHLGFVILLVPQIIETEKQVEHLIWVAIIVISVKALQGIVRFIALGFSFEFYGTLTNHEDPVFFITLFILLTCLISFGGNDRMRKTLLWLLPFLSLGFYVGNRRACYAGFAASVLGFIVLLSEKDRRRFMKILIPITLVFGIYLAVYWDSHGRAGMVAQAVRSTIFADDRELASSYERFRSGLARLQEDYNTAMTVRKAPVLGIGFGQKFENVMQVWGIYSLKGYICHNEVFWILGKMGSVGFFLFFFFLISAVMYGAHVFHRLQNPFLKSVCAVCVLAVISQVVVSYADMQLTYFRNMVYLGILIALIPVFKQLEDSKTQWRTEP